MSKRRERKEASSSSSSGAVPEFTAEQVALHSTREDCHVIVHGVVYDVTKFISRHPGGADAILQCAGADATEVFEQQGHPDHSLKKLEEFKVGVLKAALYTEDPKKNGGLKKKKKESLWYQLYPFLIPLTVVTVSFVSRLWVEGWFS
eukprot:TRINITY_DN80647_c0_g1_i1.p1 TRINITY_DN80647_c0_g1~~TRINITY_DN80647_c0_g1_i1.p1  ORF type:complete len:147 (-),score=35.96 TRINITY_DN80647_c0_g1_i1:205-645(-)